MNNAPLAPGLLLAAPPLGDENFDRSVVLLAEHSSEGALGWVMNGTELLSVERLVEEAGLTPEGVSLPDTESYKLAVRIGGPVSPRSAWLVYRRGAGFRHANEIVISERWAVSGSRTLVEAIGRGEGPSEFRLLLGYAGWGPGQLDDEIRRGAWMPTAFEEDVAFRGGADEMWNRAYETLLGVSPFAFTSRKPGLA